MTAATPDQAAAERAAVPAGEPEAPSAATAAPSVASPPVAEAQAGSPDFMRDLVEAMRRVADDARDTTLADIRARAEEQVRRLQEDAERRRADLHERAEADIAGVDEWVAAETQRIRSEAERRVAARRTQLEEQLAGEAGRSDEAARLVRERVAAYERELEAYHARLAEIRDPAVFAEAAKRVPSPPSLEVSLAAVPAPPAMPTTASLGAPAPSPDRAPDADVAPVTAEPEVQPAAAAETPAAEMEAAPATVASVHPAEEPLLNIQGNGVHAEPDALAATATDVARPQPVTTDVIVKGLGSFGAITGFRQTLAGIDGIEGVALSLGQTGEFVFRATHLPGFDVADAIRGLEGENAAVEAKADGALAVTLDRTR